ncbi:hypothetical protein V8C35DRAFT_297978 [Trichoderma chlorosporum]
MQAACRISQLLLPLPVPFALPVPRLLVCPILLILGCADGCAGELTIEGVTRLPCPCNQVMMDLAPPENVC